MLDSKFNGHRYIGSLYLTRMLILENHFLLMPLSGRERRTELCVTPLLTDKMRNFSCLRVSIHTDC